MWKLTRRHPDDELLIAHLDGELGGRPDRRVRSHLKTCWECRTRLARIEDQIRTLAEAREARLARAPRALAASRERLLARLDALSDDLGHQAKQTPPKLSLPRSRWSLAGAWAAAVAAVITGGLLWFGRQPGEPRPRAPETLKLTRAAETTLLASPLPVHQVFRIEAGKDTSRLEVWSDVSGRRYASRWQDESGALRCALWRPGTGQEFTYVRNTAASSSGAAPVYLAEVAATDLEQFERAFFAWLESHRWQPVSMTAEMAHFAAQSGVSLTVERIAAGLRLTARRRLAEAVLEIDAVSHRPRVLSLRNGNFGMRLVSMTSETVAPSLVPAAAFRPDVPLPSLAPAENLTRLAPRAPLPSAEELDESEVRVLYALHQAGSCQEDQVQLVRQASGAIEVRGQVMTSERKRKLGAALAAVPHVVLRVQSAEEAARPANPTVVQQVNVEVRRSAVADRLEEYLRRRFPTDAHVRAGEISDQAVSAAHAALSEAWALRRLAEWATPEKVDRMSLESSRLLAAMVRHHAAALRDRVARQDTLVRPALSTIASPAAETAAPPQPRDWQGASAAIFAGVDRLERLTVTLFARAGSSPRETEDAARSLLTALDGVDLGLTSLDTRLAQAR